MKRVVFLLLSQVLFFGLGISAQTVSPLIVECGKKCRGEFSITNNGLTPLAVTVEARSFSLDTLGRATNRPLDPGVDLKLEEGSARVAPKGTHIFAYQLNCAAPPLLGRARRFDGRRPYRTGRTRPRATCAHRVRLRKTEKLP
jgi:hypothetical protein